MQLANQMRLRLAKKGCESVRRKLETFPAPGGGRSEDGTGQDLSDGREGGE